MTGDEHTTHPKTLTRHVEAADGVQIAIEATGDPSDPALLLVMGATASMIGWPDSLVSGLVARGRFVVRFDHRDTGLSTTWPLGESSYDVEDLVDDVMAVMDDLSLPAVDLVGMSLGGLVGQVTAVRAPERIRTLTLIAAEPLGWDGDPLPTIDPSFMDHFATMGELDWGDDAAVEEFLVGGMRLSAGGRADFDEAAARTEAKAVIRRSPSLLSAYNHGALALRDEWTGAFRRIDRPVLVIHGELDPILPLPNGVALAEGIEGARLHTLPGVGHELPAVEVRSIVEEIGAFLSE